MHILGYSYQWIKRLANTASTGEGVSYIQPFMMSMLMGAFTLIGFETSANLSEETLDPRRNVPKAVIGSIVISGVIGLLFLIAITFAIIDLPGTMAAASPLTYIIEANLGSLVGTIFLIIVSVSIFACGTVAMTSGSRLVYAMARDNAIFFSESLKKVSPKTSSPIYATILILFFGILGAVGSDSLATIWLIFELGILTIPEIFHKAAFVGIVLIAIGFALYYAIFRKRIEGTDSSTVIEDMGIQEMV